MMQHLAGARPLAVVAPAPRRPLRPQRSTCVVYAAASDDLESWQKERIQQAAAAGRRTVKVERLCKELGLPRQAVLAALKDLPPPDRAQLSLLQARAAAEDAAAERHAVLQQSEAAARGSRGDADGPQVKGPAAQRGGPRGGGSGGRGNSGTPPWKQYKRHKTLGRQAEATLEMIFARTAWPSDDAVSSLWDLHRLPREKVVEWFQQRRRQDQRRQGSGGSGGGRGSAGPAAAADPKTDWDTEWAQE